MYTGSLSASNRADWLVDVTVLDADTNAGIDVTGAAIVVSVREIESDKMGFEVLSGSTGNGVITFPDVNDPSIFRWTFPRSSMASLAARDYDLGVTIEFDGITTQVLAGTLFVIDGVVP